MRGLSKVQTTTSLLCTLQAFRISIGAAATLFLLASAALASSDTITLLPLLPGEYINACEARSVSSQQQLIVGDCFNYTDPIGVYWDRQLTVHRLAANLQGATELQPVSINNSGAIAGSLCTSPDARTTPYCGPYGTGQIQAFYMGSVTGGVQIIPRTSADAPMCMANGMNNLGQVVGYCQLASDLDDPLVGEAFLWSPSGGTQEVSGLPECRLHKANAILDDGTILGLSTGCGVQNLTKFFMVLPGGKAHQVAPQCAGLYGDTWNFAGGLALDHSIGGSCDAHAFVVDSQGNFTSLFPVTDHDFTSVYGFDNHGLALGYDAGATFLYSGGQITYVSTLFPGFQIINAWSIDSASQIVGQAAPVPSNGTTPAYIMHIGQ